VALSQLCKGSGAHVLTGGGRHCPSHPPNPMHTPSQPPRSRNTDGPPLSPHRVLLSCHCSSHVVTPPHPPRVDPLSHPLAHVHVQWKGFRTVFVMVICISTKCLCAPTDNTVNDTMVPPGHPRALCSNTGVVQPDTAPLFADQMGAVRCECFPCYTGPTCAVLNESSCEEIDASVGTEVMAECVTCSLASLACIRIACRRHLLSLEASKCEVMAECVTCSLASLACIRIACHRHWLSLGANKCEVVAECVTCSLACIRIACHRHWLSLGANNCATECGSPCIASVASRARHPLCCFVYLCSQLCTGCSPCNTQQAREAMV
jgi:hypothetical protein